MMIKSIFYTFVGNNPLHTLEVIKVIGIGNNTFYFKNDQIYQVYIADDKSSALNMSIFQELEFGNLHSHSFLDYQSI